MYCSVPNVDNIIRDSRGLWISGIFGSLIGWNPGYDLLKYKEMFFILIKDLLDRGVIRFCSPDDPLGNNELYWDADSDTIVTYLRACWPNDVSGENDDALNVYFYSIPTVLWADESGKYIGS